MHIVIILKVHKLKECMLIETKQRLVKCRKICIEINNVVLETVDVAKLLGVNIDCSLSLLSYIQNNLA
jgi:hypothetical protein